MDNSSFDTQIPTAILHDSDEGIALRIKKAYEYYSAGSYRETLDLLANDPILNKIPYVLVLIGNCYKNLSNTDKAMKYWYQSIETAPIEHAAFLNIGNILYSQKNENEAIKFWTQAYALKPEDPVVNLNLAVAYKTKGCRIKATKFFEHYLRFKTNEIDKEYLTIKENILTLRAKVELYYRKLNEYKNNGDLKSISSLYVKMISVYANLPNAYINLANIFLIDKNYEKALEFFLIVYKNFSYNNQIVWNIANLYEMSGKKADAFCFYRRCEKLFKKNSTKYQQTLSKINALSYSAVTNAVKSDFINKAQELENQNLYEDALVEYENAYYSSIGEAPDIQEHIERLKKYIEPEPFVIAHLYNKINNYLNLKKYTACIEFCDRIILLAPINSRESLFAVRCKTECKRLMMANESSGNIH